MAVGDNFNVWKLHYAGRASSGQRRKHVAQTDAFKHGTTTKTARVAIDNCFTKGEDENSGVEVESKRGRLSHSLHL